MTPPMNADETSPSRGKEVWSKQAVVMMAGGELDVARVLATLRVWDRFRLVTNGDCTLGIAHMLHRLVGQDPYSGAAPTCLPEDCCKKGTPSSRRFEELFDKVTSLSETVSTRIFVADGGVVSFSFFRVYGVSLCLPFLWLFSLSLFLRFAQSEVCSGITVLFFCFALLNIRPWPLQ